MFALSGGFDRRGASDYVPSWYECLGACKRERLVWPHCACRTWAGQRMRGVRCDLCGGGTAGGGGRGTEAAGVCTCDAPRPESETGARAVRSRAEAERGLL